MMTKTKLITSVLIIAGLIGLLFLIPPFLLPNQVYKVLYGRQYPKVTYAGDAKLTDVGPNAASDRWVAEMGRFTNKDNGTYEYILADLPMTAFTIGFDVFGSAKEPLIDSKPVTSYIRVHMVNRNGGVVIDESAPLNQWTWSGAIGEPNEAFVYRRGTDNEEKDIHDGGWGTVFDPSQNSEYKVTLTMEPIQKTSENEFLLVFVARGGGWK